mmetsp:Transcript_28241/g.41724  ORF Transcript_28241/g.41724 Transcript_28241/m.41724 type:complete len:297 (+) Transcript_28241:46-936(+)|eukprot:CAMPEP_0194213278 /NCGR_PEP_ID=MMETSP0156-20130528/13701_1 /TAXON_ID=33649 /ORGANISM="Thalassionema nitzschioides, Strain L26-B" /LENGTH=296 /DNA_ID=CAMNT_0038941271 /DNA_START=25 /DNA_END=915 /DNA_ORIENTATION=-
MRSRNKLKELVKPKKLYGRDAGGIFFKRFKKEKKSESLSIPVIGWDDVNCRPIFDLQSNSTLSQASEESAQENLYDEKRSEGLQWNGRKKTKSYKILKKGTFFASKEISAMVHSRKSHTKQQQENSKDNSFQFSSPAPQEKICRNLDSHTKRNIAKETESNTAARAVPSKQRQNQAKSNKSKQFDFVDETAKNTSKQPNFKTDISAAKNFFDNLDATESLVVVSSSHSQTPLKVGSKCGRSYRRINVDNDELQEEYYSYKKASQESGVEPLSLTEFAKNRSNIFRPNEMFDGFLDG